jgi:hypothetical protein
MRRHFPAKVLILLDAFDECDDDRSSITQSLAAHFLITSRPEQDISTQFKTWTDVTTIDMDPVHDIQGFLAAELAKDDTLERFRDEIITKLKSIHEFGRNVPVRNTDAGGVTPAVQ